MRAHAARRPNVFVLGAKPSLARAFAATSVGGTRSPYVGRFSGGVDACHPDNVGYGVIAGAVRDAIAAEDMDMGA